MTDTTWGKHATLEYGRGLTGYWPEKENEDDVRVFGTNGPIGWYNRALVDGPGVIVGRKGEYRGVHYSPAPFWVIDTAYYLKVDIEQVDIKWAYYQLRTVNINRLNSGGAIPSLKREDFYAIGVRIPPLSVQRRIAAILSAYDDLIEKNRRRIQLLEQAARLIYQEWFVRLRFPGHGRVRVVDGAPEGWERTSVGRLCSYLNRGISPNYNDDAEGLVINQKCIRDRLLDMTKARRQDRPFGPEKQVQMGDLLINSTGEGTLGRVAQVKMKIPNCTVDSHVTIVRPSSEIGWRYFGMAVMELEPHFSVMGRGATNQTELSRATIAEAPLLAPAKPIMDRFEAIISPISQQVINLTEQIGRLREARDLLLPRVMSGEVGG